MENGQEPNSLQRENVHQNVAENQQHRNKIQGIQQDNLKFYPIQQSESSLITLSCEILISLLMLCVIFKVTYNTVFKIKKYDLILEYFEYPLSGLLLFGAVIQCCRKLNPRSNTTNILLFLRENNFVLYFSFIVLYLVGFLCEFIFKEDMIGWNFCRAWIKISCFVILIYQMHALTTLKNCLKESKYSHKWVALVKIVFKLCIVEHIFALIWIYIGIVEQEQEIEDSWIIKRELVDKSNSTIYFQAVYFGIITMATVGYGDISAVAIKEVQFIVFIGIFFLAIFSKFLTDLIAAINKLGTNKWDNYLKDLSKLLQISGIPNNLIQKTVNWLKQGLKNKKYKLGEKAQWKICLPSYLEDELIAAKLDRFRIMKKFSLPFKRELDQTMKLEVYAESRFIITEQKQPKNPELYFIIDGEVEVSLRDNEQQQPIVKKLKQGQCFGENQFFAGKKQSMQAITLTQTHILSITKNEFLELIGNYPQDNNTFIQIQQLILSNQADELFYQNYKNNDQLQEHDFNQLMQVNNQPIQQQQINEQLVQQVEVLNLDAENQVLH